MVIEIDKQELRYFSNKNHKWQLEHGTYRFYLAKNVEDESNYVDIEVTSDDEIEDYRETLSSYYDLTGSISNEEFETLIGHKLDLKHKKRPFTIESPIKDLSKTFFGWIIFGIAKIALTKGLNKNDKKMYLRSIPYQPIRSIQMVAPLSKTFIDGIVDIFNHHPIRGIKKMKQK